MAPGGSNKPFQLLEINLISAQDLEPIYKKMRTYAKAWVHPNRKLSSCVDTEGNNNPTWNDKFVFRVDESWLRQDTSAVMIEVYTTHWFRDVLVGTVRVLVGNLIPPTVRAGVRQSNHIGMRFVALQIRRPSGRPQGILNIGVTVLDSSLRSMPLYKDFASAVGYRDIMEDPPNLQQPQKRDNDSLQDPTPKPMLRRSRSERSEHIAYDDFTPGSSLVGLPIPKPAPKDGSILSISEFVDPIAVSKKGKASSVISGAELVVKPKGKKKGKASSMVNGEEVKKPRQKGKRGGKASSLVSPTFPNKDTSPILKIDEVPIDNVKPVQEDNGKTVQETANKGKPPMKSPPKHEMTPKVPLPLPQPQFIKGGRFKGSSILSGSEIGPSPSEVAGMMAAERRYPLNDNESSVLDGWSLDESVEGLKSKLERWRTELPPLYDHHGYSSASYRSSSVYSRKRTEKDSGLFSCFGNICGYECQCVCGKPPGRKNNGGRYSSSKCSSGSRSTFL